MQSSISSKNTVSRQEIITYICFFVSTAKCQEWISQSCIFNINVLLILAIVCCSSFLFVFVFVCVYGFVFEFSFVVVLSFVLLSC